MLAWGGGEELAKKYDLPFLGRVPIEPKLAECGDTGQDYIAKFAESPLAKIFVDIAQKIVASGAQQSADMEIQ